MDYAANKTNCKSDRLVLAECQRTGRADIQWLIAALLVCLYASMGLPNAHAQDWQTGVEPNTTTLVPKSETAPQAAANPSGPRAIKLVAYLTDAGQRIDKGLVWRIYDYEGSGGTSRLLNTSRQASPTINLTSGRYIINASFGRAHITREITVAQRPAKQTKKFILNAGGLRVKALLESGAASGQASVRYNIFTDRDQLDNRELVLADVKPGLIIRLNSGIYHIVSKYGDANATVASDVTVEPGKLTEATITHSAAKVRFKLVERPGGEALSATQWQVKTSNGDVVKTSVGALPTHILAPGSYTVVGISNGQTYEHSFTINNGQMLDIEVLKR